MLRGKCPDLNLRLSQKSTGFPHMTIVDKAWRWSKEQHLMSFRWTENMWCLIQRAGFQGTDESSIQSWERLHNPIIWASRWVEVLRRWSNHSDGLHVKRHLAGLNRDQGKVALKCARFRDSKRSRMSNTWGPLLKGNSWTLEPGRPTTGS